MKKSVNLEITVLERAGVEKLIGLDSETFALLVYQWGFPPPIVVCGQEVGWSEKEVMEWFWIKAIEASWSSDSRWNGEAYSSLRHPSNLLGLNRELLKQIKAYIRELYQDEEKELRPTSVNPADPFGDAIERDVARI